MTTIEKAPALPKVTDNDDCFDEVEFVRRLARRLVSDEHLANDIAQEAWLATLRRKPGPLLSPKAYLATVVRHVVSNQLRSLARRRLHERESVVRNPMPEDEQERQRCKQVVLKALSAIPEHYRVAVWLRYGEGLPPRELAAHLGVPVETARTRVKRGLVQMRRQLDREFDGERTTWKKAFIASGLIRREPVASLGAGGVGALALVAACALIAIFFGAHPEQGLANVVPGPAVVGPYIGPLSTMAAARTDAGREACLVRREVEVLVDEDGRWVPNAVITATWDGGSARARTGGVGPVTMDLPSGQDLLLSVSATGRTRGASLALDRTRSRAADRVVVRVGSLRSVSGTVVDAQGRSRAGVELIVARGGNPFTAARDENGLLHAFSDSQGRFDLQALPSMFSVRAEGDGLVALEVLVGREVPPGDYEGFEIAVVPEVTVNGEVRDASGLGLAQAYVQILPEESEVRASHHAAFTYRWWAGRQLTSAEGRFAPSRAPSGNHRLVVWKEHFAPEVVSLRADGGLEDYDVVLRRAHASRLRVIDPLGHSLTEALVRFVRPSTASVGEAAPMPPPRERAEVDEDGLCTLTGLAEGSSCLVSVEAEGFSAQVLLLSGDDADAIREVVLQPERQVLVRVIDGDGALAGAQVTVRPRLDHLLLRRRAIQPELLPLAQTGSTDESGIARIDGAPSGPLQVEVVFEAEPGKTVLAIGDLAADRDEIVVSAGGDVMQVMLSVTDARTASPVESFAVSAYSPSLGLHPRAEGRHGVLELTLPASPDWRVFIESDGFACANERLPPMPSQALEVDLHPTRAEIVRLVDRDGNPQSTAHAHVTDPEGNPVLCRTWEGRLADTVAADDTGRVRLADLPSAPVLLEVHIRGMLGSIQVPLDALPLRHGARELILSPSSFHVARQVDLSDFVRRLRPALHASPAEEDNGSLFSLQAFADNGDLVFDAEGRFADGLDFDIDTPTLTFDAQRPWHTAVGHDPNYLSSHRSTEPELIVRLPVEARRLRLEVAGHAPLEELLEPSPACVSARCSQDLRPTTAAHGR